MVKGILGGRLKSAQHHWWPRGVSAYWADKDGLVTQVEASGRVTRAPPGNFGAIGNAHQVKMGGGSNPWNFDFEPLFGPADNDAGNIIEFLCGLEVSFDTFDINDIEFEIKSIDGQFRERIAHFISAMIIRNPSTREIIRSTTDYYLDRFGVKERKVDKSIIAANIHNYFNFLSRNISDNGMIAAIVTDSREFIFGDGVFSSLPLGVNFHGGEVCFLPLTPSIAVIYANFGVFSPFSILTARVSNDVVESINKSTQICSRDRLFYRSCKPKLLDVFTCRQHFRLDVGASSFIDSMISGLRRSR